MMELLSSFDSSMFGCQHRCHPHRPTACKYSVSGQVLLPPFPASGNSVTNKKKHFIHEQGTVTLRYGTNDVSRGTNDVSRETKTYIDAASPAGNLGVDVRCEGAGL